MNTHPILAIIPARGGSKGLPGKNIRPLNGHPLIAYTIAYANQNPQIQTTICSTDDPAIQQAALQYGANAPALRPSDLATDTTPMLPVLKHAATTAQQHLSITPKSILLLDPTSPGRTQADLNQMVNKLEANPTADGIISASPLEPNPIWYGVVEKDGYLQDLLPEGKTYTRRQDVPPVYKINGLLYLWRTEFLMNTDNWRDGNLLIHVTDPSRDHNIDTPEDFAQLENDLAQGNTSIESQPKKI